MSEPRVETNFWRGTGPHGLSAEQAEEIDRRCDRFEQAWRGGACPRHEDHLGDDDGPFRDVLKAELLDIELEWRRRPRNVPAEGPKETGDVWPAGRSVLETLSTAVGSVPRVLLRDTDGGPEPPLHRPNHGGDASPGLRYRIDGMIARGGMGSVLKGRDPDIGRDVALKVLREEYRNDVDMVRRFVEEAQIGGQLQHPGIVPIYEMGTFGDLRPFFSMKLVKGDTLAKLLAGRKDPKDGLPRFLSIFESIAQTMAYAHARGVIHRDLKPSNVMVGSFGEVQVMDWGLAKVLPRGGIVDDAAAGKLPKEETVIATARSGSADSDLSKAGSVLGTPSYMAPEQARGEIDRVDERADVFALGSILGEILTGRPAFIGRHGGEIQRKAAVGDLAGILARLDSCGADTGLLEIARDCLAREPEDRPKSAGAVAERISSHLAGVQERLRRAELASVEERARRRLTTVAAAALILLGVVGGGGYAWVERQRTDRAARTARAVEEALADAVRLRGEARSASPGDSGRWSAALAAAKRAEGVLGDEADAPLKDRVAALVEGVGRERAAAAEQARQAEVDRVLLDDLESIRARRVDHRDPKRSDAEYAEVFRKAGLDLDATEADRAGRWLGARTDPVEMAGYLDDWAFARRASGRPEADWSRLVASARRGDPDPWRDALRARFAANDPASVAEFRRMADDPKLEDQPAPGLLLLARQLKFGCGDRDRAARVLRRAARRHSGDFRVHFELAQAPGSDEGISDQQYPLPDEAVRHLTAALSIRPGSASTHLVLSAAYLSYRKRDEAEAECREAVRIKPGDHNAHAALGNVLRWAWKFDEAEAECREAVRIKPDDLPGHIALAVVLMDMGRFDEAAVEFRELIRQDRRSSGGYIGLADSYQKKGDYAAAAAVLRDGREQGAKYIPNYFHPTEWFVKSESTWVALGARLPSIVKGEDRPKNQEERLDLAKMCRGQLLYAASARLLADAMAEDSRIAEDRRGQRRYDAACYATLAGSGRSRDDPPPDEAERARLRAQALRWLQGEREAWVRYIEPGTPQVRMTVALTMTHWRADGDLTAVRDPAALAKLPEDERREWQALWADVQALLTRAEGKGP